MSGAQKGRAPTDAELALAELAKRFTPEKQIEFLQNTASRVLTQTALIGTVLGAGGLVALTTIVANPVSFILTVLAVGGSFLAILLALSTQVTVLRRIKVGDLKQIESWYQRYRGWRGIAVSSATWVLLGSFVLAAAAVVVAMSHRSPSPTFDVTASITPAAPAEPGAEQAPDTYTVKASITVRPEGVDDVLTLTVDSGSEAWASTQKHATGEAPISVALEAAGIPVDGQVTVSGDSNSWRCTATISDGTVSDSACDEKEDEGNESDDPASD